jgi:ATP synthase protein I
MKHPKKIFNYKANKAWAENLQIIMQIGLTMAGSIAFCLFVGLKIDKWLGTKGIFTVILLLYGIVGGGYVVYKQILKTLEPDRTDNKTSENGRD